MPQTAPAARSARPSLATWLFASVLGATIAAVLTCTLVIERFVRDEVRLDATRFLQTSADALRDALDRGMAQHVEEVRVIGQLDQVAAGSDPAAIRRALDQMHASFPQFAWLGLADGDGKVVAAVDGLLQGASVAARPWFAGAQHGVFVGDVHRAVLLEKLLPAQAEPWRFVDVATPVYAADGRLRGILGAHLSWTWAAQIKRELSDRALQEQRAEALVVAADGTVLLGSPDQQGRKLGPDRADVLSVHSRTQGAGRFPGLGWDVVLRQPESVALASYDALRLRIDVAAFGLCVLLAPLLWLLARRLATPLHELTARLDGTAVRRRHPLYREAELLGLALDRHARRQDEDAARLRELNLDLEARVEERTAALARINDDLTRAVRERWQSEEHMRAVLTHAPDAYIAVDEQGTVSEWNRQAEQTFGWTRPEALGQPLAQLLVPATQRGGYRGIDVLARGAPAGQRVEITARHKNGAEIPVQVSVATLRTDAGQVGYAFLHDISERKHAERMLAQSERRLRTVTDNMPALVSHIDTSLRYTFNTATYSRWLGLDVAAMRGKRVEEVVGAEAFARIEERMRRALAGEACTFESEIEVNGRRMHNLLHYIPDRDENGVVQGLYGMVLDLTERRTLELASARSEQRLRDITNAVPAVIAYFDANERCTFGNVQAARLLGVAPDQIGSKTLRDAMGTRYVEHKAAIARTLRGEKTSFAGQIDRDGRRIDFQTHCVPDIDADGRVAGMYLLAHDQTALKSAERRSAAGEQRLRTITNNLPVLISYVDREQRYQFCNGTYKEWLGLAPEQIVGRTMAETLGEQYAPRRAWIERTLAGERVDFDMETLVRGQPRHLHATYLPDNAEGGAVEGFYVLVTDVTTMKAAEAQLARQARTDSLTGLPNRHAFNERLATALARSRRSAQPIALLFLDSDKFKAINDSLGHGAGDEVLREFGQRIAASVRETDTVARLAGDEFVVVVEGLHTPAEPQVIARKILSAVNRPFEFEGLKLDITISIGIAFQPDGHVLPAELLARADKALYEAKADGRNTYRMNAA